MTVTASTPKQGPKPFLLPIFPCLSALAAGRTACEVGIAPGLIFQTSLLWLL